LITIKKPPSPLPYIIGIVIGIIGSTWFSFTYYRHQQRRVGYNPFTVGTPITDKRKFFGRKDILKRVVDGIQNNHVFIRGDYRSGKTSFLLQLKGNLEEAIDQKVIFIPVWIDLQSIKNHNHLFFEIGKSLKSYVESKKKIALNSLHMDIVSPEDYSDLHLKRDYYFVVSKIHDEIKKDPRIVLLIDEADRLSAYPPEIISLLRSLLSGAEETESLRVVMAGTRLPTLEASPGSPLTNMFSEEEELVPFTEEDVYLLVNKLSAGIYHFDKLAIKEILRVSRGQPYTIQKICKMAVERYGQTKNGLITGEQITAILDETNVPF
jgi:hypothetical protein